MQNTLERPSVSLSTTPLQTDCAVMARAHFMVPEAARILKRFMLLQREIVLQQSGWLPGSQHWNSKLLTPEFAWQDALIAAQCRERVLELRYPERDIDASEEEPLLRLWRHFADAPHGVAYVEGLRLVVKPLLREAFERYQRLTDSLDDGPTIRILRQAVEDIDEQLNRWAPAARDAQTAFPDQWETAQLWVGGARALAESIGDLLDTERVCSENFDPTPWGGKAFQIARLAQRDPRYRVLKFGWPDSLDPAFGAGEEMQLQIRQGVHHANEMWAAEMAAACIYDLADEGGPEFLADAARWCYDEIRHCRMGCARLAAWGFEPSDIPIGTFSYDAGAHADALTRLGIIFYFESTYIGTKSQRMKYFGEFGDPLSAHDMDFDWADEQIHTHYGTRWLKFFLEKCGDPRKPIAFRAVSESCIAQIRAQATPEDRQDTLDAFDHMMQRAHELALATKSKL